jgi:hypothetical protein
LQHLVELLGRYQELLQLILAVRFQFLLICFDIPDLSSDPAKDKNNLELKQEAG